MKHRSVVANFIFKRTDAEHQQVALFRRSKHPNIRSYQDKYAPISGSVDEDDANPLAAAEREILEETQLRASQDVFFEFIGQPYSFEDSDAQRSWTVHPFGWVLTADEAKIKIDWEHSGWKWVDPEHVLNGSMDQESVPKLGESLKRVYFGPNGMFSETNTLMTRDSTAGKVFVDTLNDLKTDTENGARVLASKALQGLQSILRNLQEESIEFSQRPQNWHYLKVEAYQFIHSARPSMSSAIEAAILDCLNQMVPKLSDGELVPGPALEVFETCISKRKDTVAMIARQFTSFVERLHNNTVRRSDLSIFTLSASSTIVAAITDLLQSDVPVSKINLIVLESRPQCEGATFAAKIASEYDRLKAMSSKPLPCLRIRIAPDTHASLLLRQTPPTDKTIVLLGADHITPLSNTINKTGSANLAVLAKALGPKQARVVVLSEEDKIAKAESTSLDDYEKILRIGTDHAGSQDIFLRLSEKELKAQSHEQHDVDEVSKAWSEKAQATLLPLCRNDQGGDLEGGEGMLVHVDNIYFEFIPPEYIGIFISENGEMSREDVLRKSVERTKLEAAIFQDLYGTVGV